MNTTPQPSRARRLNRPIPKATILMPAKKSPVHPREQAIAVKE
jgi:hypothetical protein